ncbi:Rv3654c family TadE-like protein [Nonomuraea roseoviolacea]|nr:Rv3654c family TadE-like protein [Nonomuraea roseoviolacea]
MQIHGERSEVFALDRGVGGRDRGSATLWGVALMGILMSVAMAFAAVASARVARHRVNAAADLSALAAAKLAIADPDEACRKAAIVAAENGAKLTRCQIKDEIADVWTSMTARLLFVGSRSLTGRSRAGPGREDQPVDQAGSPSELDRLEPPE